MPLWSKNNSFFPSFAWLLLCAALPEVGYAQNVSLHGRVLQQEPDGGLVGTLPKARVELLSESGDVIQSTITDDTGYYALREVSPDAYQYRITSPGTDNKRSAGGESGEQGRLSIATASGELIRDFVVNKSSDAENSNRLIIEVVGLTPDGTISIPHAAVGLQSVGGDRNARDRTTLFGRTDASGRLSLQVPPGTWRAQATAGGFEVSAAKQVNVTQGNDNQPVQLRLKPDQAPTATAFQQPPPSAGEPNTQDNWQPTAGSTIHGHIFAEDESGNLDGLVPGAQIELANQEGQVQGQHTTSESGYYSFHGISQGNYKVTLSGKDVPNAVRDLEVVADAGSHVVDFLILRAGKQLEELGRVEISVFTKTDKGRKRQTNAAVLLWRSDQRKTLDEADPIGGIFETHLSPGQWMVSASVPGFESPQAQPITVEEGAVAAHDIVLSGEQDAQTIASVFIAVQPSDGSSPETGVPEAHFVGSGKSIPCIIRPIAEEAVEGGAGKSKPSQWIWFEGRPETPLKPGEYRVEGAFETYPQASSATQPVLSNQSADFTLTFRPKERQATVRGVVHGQTDQRPLAPLATKATLQFENVANSETRQVESSADGKYQVALPPGNWWSFASATKFQNSRSVLVHVEPGQTVQQNFVVKGTSAVEPDDPGTRGNTVPAAETRLLAVVEVVGGERESDETPSVRFSGRSNSVDATVRKLSADELDELGVTKLLSNRSVWFAAVPTQAVGQDIWTAKSTLAGFTEDAIAQVVRRGEARTFHLRLKPLDGPDAAQGQLAGQVRSSDGEPIHPAQVRVWRDDGSDKPHVIATEANGNFSFSLANGAWWIAASAGGYYSPGANVITVAGETQHNPALLPLEQLPQVTAIVSVERAFEKESAAEPTISFDSQLGGVPARLRRLDTTDTGVSATGWDMYEATPAYTLPENEYWVSGKLDGYEADKTPPQLVVEARQTFFDLALRPTLEQSEATVLLAGRIYLEQDGQRRPLPTAQITISQPDGESKSFVGEKGVYRAELKRGLWLIHAESGKLQTSDQVWLETQSRIQRDIVFRASQTVNPPGQRSTKPQDSQPEVADALAIIEVLRPSPDQSPPTVQFSGQFEVAYASDSGEPRTAMVAKFFNAKLERLDTGNATGSIFYAARPLKPLDVPGVCHVVVTPPTDRYTQVVSDDQTLDKDRLTLFREALHPMDTDTELGQLVGCVRMETLRGPVQLVPPGESTANTELTTYLAAESWTKEGPLEQSPPPASNDAPLGASIQTLPVRDVDLVLTNLETGQQIRVKAETGCFEQQLPQGSWKATVLLSEMQPWEYPQRIEIKDGQNTRHDLVIPLDHSEAGPLPTAEASVEAVIAVWRSDIADAGRQLAVGFGRSVSDSKPVVKQREEDYAGPDGSLRTRTVMYSEIEETQGFQEESVGHVVSLNAQEIRERGLLAPDGQADNWEWYLATPRTPLPEGTYELSAKLPGYESSFSLGVVKTVTSGNRTVFDDILIPFAPRLILNFVDSNYQPFPDVTAQVVKQGGDRSFDDALTATSDITGTLGLALEDGLGAYTVVVGGAANIQRTVVNLDVMDRVNQPEPIMVLVAGETPRARLEGRVFGKSDSAGTALLPIAGAEIHLLLPESDVQAPGFETPLVTDATGGFGWNFVPEGQYGVCVQAEGFHSECYPVQVAAGQVTPSLSELMLFPRDRELEQAILRLLVDCWEPTPATRSMARETYASASKKNPKNIALDFAAAMVLTNASDLKAAENLLHAARRAGKTVGLAGDNRSLEYHHAYMLLMYLTLNRGNTDNTIELVRSLAKREYSGTETVRDADYTVYSMGLSTGMLAGPWTNHAEPGEGQRLRDEILSVLSEGYRPIFDEGYQDVLATYQQLLEDIEQNANPQTMQDSRSLTVVQDRMTSIEQRLIALKNEDREDANRARVRLDELDVLIRSLRKDKDVLHQEYQQLAMRNRETQQLLRENALQQQQLGENPDPNPEDIKVVRENERVLQNDSFREKRDLRIIEAEAKQADTDLATQVANRTAILRALQQASAARAAENHELRSELLELDGTVQAIERTQQTQQELQDQQLENVDMYWRNPLMEFRDGIIEYIRSAEQSIGENG